MASIDDLPEEILVTILSKAGQESWDNFFNAKSTCKRLYKASNNDLVYQRLSLERLTVFSWFPMEREILQRCFEAGNLQAIFRFGLYQYFQIGKNPDWGLLLLKQAADYRQLEAIFVYGLILLASGVEDLKTEGLVMLNSTFSHNLRSVEEIREKVVVCLRQLLPWRRRSFQEPRTKCQVAGHLGYVTNIFAPVITKADCMTCFWCHELEMVDRTL